MPLPRRTAPLRFLFTVLRQYSVHYAPQSPTDQLFFLPPIPNSILLVPFNSTRNKTVSYPPDQSATFPGAAVSPLFILRHNVKPRAVWQDHTDTLLFCFCSSPLNCLKFQCILSAVISYRCLRRLIDSYVFPQFLLVLSLPISQCLTT